MDDAHFRAACEAAESRPASLGVSGFAKLQAETLERLEKAEAILMQIGWWPNDGTLFMSFNFTEEQAGVLAKALEYFDCNDKRSYEEKVTQMFAAWIKIPEDMK
jgi:hypothetical protein